MFKMSAVAILFAASPVFANCVGSSSFYTCNDSSGNSYTVNRMGNMTNMQGYNSQTGSQWSQSSQTFGNTTLQSGQTNGQSWNQTIQTGPLGTTYSGSDSRGRSFHRQCNQYGCF